MPNTPKAKIAVIGGTGLEDIEGLTEVQQVNIDTPFGKPSDAITVGKLDDVGIAFLPRHGRGHFISPTELPVRANIYALNRWAWSISSPCAVAAASNRNTRRVI